MMIPSDVEEALSQWWLAARSVADATWTQAYSPAARKDMHAVVTQAELRCREDLFDAIERFVPERTAPTPYGEAMPQPKEPESPEYA